MPTVNDPNVTSQSHSFSSDTILSPSFKSNYNTLTDDTTVNFSASFTIQLFHMMKIPSPRLLKEAT